jgi:hypothetical protein
MRSPALAIGWELWAKHRLGLLAIAAWSLAAALLVQVMPRQMAENWIGVPSIILGCFSYLYLLWMFAYAESTLAGNDAGFPPRLFVVPVRTSVLIAWPMFYGMVTVALFWLLIQMAILNPCGARLESWPALLLAASLASYQALCWTIFRAPLVRLVLAVLALPMLNVSDLVVRAQLNVPTNYRMVLLPGPLIVRSCATIVLAYLIAWVGVANDRRGERLSIGWRWEQVTRALARRFGQRRLFPSAAQAQRWLEIRRCYWAVPTLVVPLALLLNAVAGSTFSSPDVMNIAVAITGPACLFAILLGFGLGKTSFWAIDLHLSPFLASRPVTSTALARAKLDAAAWCAARTGIYLFLLTGLLLLALGNGPSALRLAHFTLGRNVPDWLLAVSAVLSVAGLVGTLWFYVLTGMCLSIAGRVWLANATALLYLAACPVGSAVISEMSHSLYVDRILILSRVLWGVGIGLTLCKLAALGATLRLTWHERTVPVLAAWAAVVACLLIPLWAVVPPNPVPHALVTLYVVLAVPLSRPLLLPAAIAWNRHR